MVKTILFILGIVLSTIGVILVYDARSITKKAFGFGDQNEATAGLKILGFVMAMIGALIIYYNV